MVALAILIRWCAIGAEGGAVVHRYVKQHAHPSTQVAITGSGAVAATTPVCCWQSNASCFLKRAAAWMAATSRFTASPTTPYPKLGGFLRMISPANPAKGAARCSSCEAICCRLTVVLQPEERIPDHLTTHSPEGLRVMKHGEDGWCVALDRTRKNCGIYETRPSVCRRFVMNGAYCRAVRADYRGQVMAETQPEPAA